MNDTAFQKQQQDAVARMREMNSRSAYKNPPKPPEPEPPKEKSQKSNSLLDSLNIPFLDTIKKDGDVTLILGLLLLLFSEKADKRLLFALIYILL